MAEEITVNVTETTEEITVQVVEAPPGPPGVVTPGSVQAALAAAPQTALGSLNIGVGGTGVIGAMMVTAAETNANDAYLNNLMVGNHVELGEGSTAYAAMGAASSWRAALGVDFTPMIAPNIQSVANGGANSVGLYMDSGTTLNGVARNAWFGPGFRSLLLSPGVAGHGINFARTFEIAFTLTLHAITGGGRFLLLVGADTTAFSAATNYTPSGTQYCGGLEIIGTALRAYSYVAAGIATGSDYTVAQGNSYDVLLKLTPTVREVYVNGELASSVTAGTANNPGGNAASVAMAAIAPAATNRMVAQVSNLRYRSLP